MRIIVQVLAMTIATACLVACSTTTALPETVNAQTLIGVWKVDLRPKPGAPDYYQTFEVIEVNGKSFTGIFYGTPITQGRINVDWGAVRFAFVTEDLSGPYNHSGVLKNGKIEGLSHSLGRKFLSYWSAVKEQ